MLRVELPTLREGGGTVRVESRLETSRGAEVLWYELDRRHAPHVMTARLDGFAVAALLVAMERGEQELVLAGPVSERLLYNLRQLIPILKLETPQLSPVAIRADHVQSNGAPGGRGVVTGFSGGIDSSCTIAEYRDPPSLPAYRLTHLLFCNVGSHDRGEAGRRLFRSRQDLLGPVAGSLQLPMVVVDSNLPETLAGRFEPTLTHRTASVVLLLQGLFGTFLHSSSHAYADSYIRAAPYSHADPVVAPLLSTESLEVIPAGSRHTRVEKTRIALGLPHIRDFLNVCIQPRAGGRNCSSCVKCLRTLAALDLLGELDGFDRVFDLALYRRWTHRLQYLALLPGRRDDDFIRELYAFARTGEARLPRWIAKVHDWWPVVGLPYRTARSAQRLLRGGAR